MPQVIGNVRTAPYNAVVRITETIDGQTWQGSGVMLAADEVLTAGHVAYRTGTTITGFITLRWAGFLILVGWRSGRATCTTART